MRRTEIDKLVGDIAILDLVSGLEIVTEIVRIDIDGYVITSAPWMIFQADIRPKDPRLPADPANNPVGWHVSHGEYGNPVFKVEDDKPLDLSHIICAHECPKPLAGVYTKMRSGIEIADAGALTRLDAANQQQRR